MYFALRNSLIEKDSSFKVDLNPNFLDAVSYSLLNHEELTSAISELDVPEDHYLYFVYLNGDRLYTERCWNLNVFLLSDLSSPIATYPLCGECYSGIITDNRLYLSGGNKLHIFEVATSITQPLMLVTIIQIA
jgi:hypothetical protein